MKTILNFIDETAPGTIDTILSSKIDSYGKPCTDCYLLSNRKELLDSLNDNDHEILREKLISRLKDSPIKIIFYCKIDSKYKSYIIGKSGLQPYQISKEELAKVRSQDLLSIAEKYSEESFLTGGKQYHFATPSHNHTNIFFRLGDSIKNRDDLDRVSFWLLESVDKSDYLFIDSWSIAALPLRALQMLGKQTPFDALPAHPAKKTVDCTHLLKCKISSLKHAKNPLLIVSVVSSGALIDTFEKIFSDVVLNGNLSVLSVYSFTEQDYSLCKLNYEVINYSFENCALCSDGSVAIEIHPSSYYVKDMRDIGVNLTKDIAKENFTFFQKYQTHIDSLISFHRGDPAKNKKHYAYYIDFKKMAEIEAFKEEAIKKIFPSIVEGALLISLIKDSFTDFISEKKNVTLEKINGITDIGSNNLIKKIELSPQVIIYDPVVINGDYFDTVNRYIRENRAISEKISNILFLCGLFRPSKPKESTGIESTIAYSQEGVARKFSYVESLTLPDDRESTCPWCIERRAIESVLKPTLRRNGVYDERLSILSNLDKGIVGNDAFFHTENLTKDLVLGSDSYLGPQSTSAAGVMLAVASGLQNLREHSKEEKRLTPKFPFTQVLGVKNFERYSEGLIRAALIRATSPFELGMREKEKIMCFLQSQLMQEDQKMLFSEYLMAMLCGKFPPYQQNDPVAAQLRDLHSFYPEVLNIVSRAEGRI